MIKRLIAHSRSINWNHVLSVSKGRAFNVLLIVALTFATFSPGLVPLVVMGPAPEVAPRAQPLLLAMAAERPDETVRVIVQKLVKDASVEELVARLGGVVISDLWIINAFAAQLPVGAVPELARAAGVHWVSLDAPMKPAQGSDTTVFITWATELGTVTPNGFTNAAAMVDSALGPNEATGYGSNVKGAFAGFEAEVTPGHAISKVEVVLHAYAPVKLGAGDDPKLSVVVGGQASKSQSLNHHAFDTYVGASNAGTVYVDITGLRTWQWADFDNGLEVVIDQGKFKSNHFLYYDAIGLRVTSAPGNDPTGGADDTSPLPDEPVDPQHQVNVYNNVIGAEQLWNDAKYLQGKDVVVALVDSGIFKTGDLAQKPKNFNFNQGYHDSKDRYGHGTFVAGIIAGSGKKSHGQYIGVAPKAKLLNVRVSDDQGMSYESDVVEALQWVYEHQDKYKIRVVNLSLNSSLAQSYHTSPLCLAAEILWFNGIVVVVSAGNNGSNELYPPANDPFVITVGATDDQGTLGLADDAIASFSAYGTTPVLSQSEGVAGTAKPELVAPGTHIVGYLPGNNKLTMVKNHADHRVSADTFRMSGTSMSAPMVSGAVAILLQDEPELTPNQVKYRLMATANRSWPGYDPDQAGAGYLDIYAAVYGTTVERANAGIMPNLLLAKMAVLAAWASTNGVLDWNNVNWDSINWDSVNWDSVNWDSVNWDSVNWDSVNWDSVNWDSVNWDSVNWDSVNWDSVNWDTVNWDSVNWDSVNWDSDYWD